MADSTTVLGLPFPEGSDANDVPADMQALAERVDETPGVESLTTAEIAALAAGQKPAGRVVYNSTTGKLQQSNGTSFVNVTADALPLAGGTMSGPIAMGSQKITGLAAGTAAGDALRHQQVQSGKVVAGTTGSVVVTFPVAFANAPAVTVTPIGASSGSAWYFTAITTDDFTVFFPSTHSGYCWIAVGN